MKRIISLLCCVVMLCMPLTVVAAESDGTWTKTGVNQWSYQDAATGTDITAKLVEHTLYVDGVGEIPSYTSDTLKSRPWGNVNLFEVVIGDSITSIGAYAFADNQYLSKVTLPVSAMIEDASAFAGANKNAFFYFEGMNFTKHDMGKLPYSSADSIANFMKAYNGVYRYSVENLYVRDLLQSYGEPKILNIVPKDAVTTATNPEYPVINYKTFMAINKAATVPGKQVLVQHKQQGKVAMEVFSIMLGIMDGYQYVSSYNVSLYDVKGMIQKTDTPLSYTMTIPAAYRYPNRTFAMIQIGNGVVNILQDEDDFGDRITFTTDTPSTVYALVYKDNF